MAKIDKSLYSKEEFRKLKAQRDFEKQQEEKEKVEVYNPTLTIPAIRNKVSANSNYILCLKHGTKYSGEYVNILYNMLQRHCTIPFQMACLTDDPSDIHKDIIPLELPDNLNGWWCKPYMFSKSLPINGTILYMDLDVVIANNIDKLFTYQPGRWLAIRDFTRVMRPTWKKYNSSVVRFQTGQLKHVWERYQADPLSIQRRFHGDQDWLYEADRNAVLWPDEWIRSWKWEVRKSREFAPGGMKGNRKLRFVENVIPTKECCITVFHGDPNPHNCEDPWVVDNWR